MNRFSGLVLLLVLLITGCASPRLEREWSDKPIGKAYEPANVYTAESLPADLRRVLVLPFATTMLEHDFMPGVENAILQALRQEGRFEVVAIGRNELYEQLGTDTLDFARPLPSGSLQQLVQRYRADAVLQTEVTAFRPYKPMVLGLRSRLFTTDNQILWSCDEVFDAGNQKIVMGARQYSERELDQPYPLQSSFSSLISPQRFAGYVGQTLFRTLPPRFVRVTDKPKS